jgi:hypothetical protein
VPQGNLKEKKCPHQTTKKEKRTPVKGKIAGGITSISCDAGIGSNSARQTDAGIL